jgi:hypothetical protein
VSPVRTVDGSAVGSLLVSRGPVAHRAARTTLCRVVPIDEKVALPGVLEHSEWTDLRPDGSRIRTPWSASIFQATTTDRVA